MRNVLLAGLLWALTSTALAQAVSSGGPVVLDYGKKVAAGDLATVAIAKKVRHELLMLPWYSLFDDLEFSVQDHTVTLSGFVTSTHAVTKGEAEGAVKHIEGVDKVVNNIQVLPPSPLDSQVRAEAYHALTRTGSLSRYFWEASPSIHIVVRNQRITLRGFVDNQGDKTMASLAVDTIPGVFQVTNDLRVVK